MYVHISCIPLAISRKPISVHSYACICTMPVRTQHTTSVCMHRTTPVCAHHTILVHTRRTTPVHPYIKYVRMPLHPPSKSEIKKDYVRTCSAFLLNDFSHKQLSEGVTNCSIIMALNIFLETLFSMLYTHYESSIGDKSNLGVSR